MKRNLHHRRGPYSSIQGIHQTFFRNPFHCYSTISETTNEISCGFHPLVRAAKKAIGKCEGHFLLQDDRHRTSPDSVKLHEACPVSREGEVVVLDGEGRGKTVLVGREADL